MPILTPAAANAIRDRLPASQSLTAFDAAYLNQPSRGSADALRPIDRTVLRAMIEVRSKTGFSPSNGEIAGAVHRRIDQVRASIERLRKHDLAPPRSRRPRGGGRP